MTRENAYVAIAAAEGVAILVANATAREMELEDQRHLVKKDAMERLISSGAATSATAAEKLVHTDVEYSAHLSAQRQAVIEKIVLEGKLKAAELRARFAVEQWAHDALHQPEESEGPTLEGLKREVVKNEEVIDRIDAMLDKAGVVEKDDQGAFLGIALRIAGLIRVLDAAQLAQCGCSILERDSGHRVGCWMPALAEAREGATA